MKLVEDYLNTNFKRANTDYSQHMSEWVSSCRVESEYRVIQILVQYPIIEIIKEAVTPGENIKIVNIISILYDNADVDVIEEIDRIVAEYFKIKPIQIE